MQTPGKLYNIRGYCDRGFFVISQLEKFSTAPKSRLPYFRSENGQYLTPGPTSNPGYKSVPWVISGIKTQGPLHPIEAKI